MNVHGFYELTISCIFLLGTAGLGKGTECSAGCHPDNGICEESGECRCKPGWQGATCEQCMPFPGCVHGTCEKAWQCICESGWIGSQCDKDANLCSSKPCYENATCIKTVEGGYLCICPQGYMGDNCELKRPCQTNGSPCQNGGFCTDNNGCSCPPGYRGQFCEIGSDNCVPNPCMNSGSCSTQGSSYTCICPPGFSGLICNISLTPCHRSLCRSGGTCYNDTDGRIHCVCSPRSPGPMCAIHPHKGKKNNPKHSGQGHLPQHYSLPSQAFHKLLGNPERELLKITLKETVHTSSPLITRNQVICFAILGLLTCMVVVGTTGIIYFSRCETWMANTKYSQLIRQQRDYLLRTANAEENSVNIILSEKIKLTNYKKHYTSI